MKRNLALCAMVSCALFAAACGADDSDDTRRASRPPTATRRGRRRSRHRRAVGVLRPGRLRQAARPARHRARGPGRQAVGAGDRARDGRHGQVQGQEGQRLEPVLLQRRGRQPVAPGRLQDDAGRRSSSTRRSPTSRAVDAEAKDDKQISDIEELAGGNCDALIVSPNTTATLTPAVEAACEKVPGHRVRPRRQHRLPGHVRPPDRRLRVRRGRRGVPEGERRAGRQDPRAAHPARAWTCWRPAGRARRSSSTTPS